MLIKPVTSSIEFVSNSLLTSIFLFIEGCLTKLPNKTKCKLKIKL